MTEQEARKRMEETRRKLQLAAEFLEVSMQEREQAGASGRVMLEFIWQDGYIKTWRSNQEHVCGDSNSNS